MIGKTKLYIGLLALGLLLLIHGSSCIPSSSPTSLGKIAFVSDREGAPFIYVMSPDGSNLTKLGGWFGVPNTFCWSPDGKRIAFINEDGWLCLVEADGGSLAKLVEIPSHSISWSPDGTKIAFSSRRQVVETQIYVMNTDDSQVSKLTTGDSSNYFPSWSPDGGKIAAGCLDYDIYTIDVDTGELKNLTNTPDIREWWPAWSPDSDKIAFIVSDPPYCDITLMGADNSNRATITSERGICEELAWSPSGEQISYTWYYRDELGPEGICRDICLVNTKDGSKVNLTNSPKFDDCDLSWSPDGRKIVFTSSGPHPVRKDICIVDADGSNVINLTNTPNIDDYLPIWSPQ